MTGSRKRPKYVPERTCIACGEKRPKWELVRVVRTPQGGVEIDPRGKEAGRGAYLCRRQECWDIGLKRRRLQHALKSEILSEQCAELMAYSKGFPELVEETGISH
jgi:predicted RNA-binding protein YlxR (DUF448 family)